jgi:peptide/nickel transport system permease protein
MLLRFIVRRVLSMIPVLFIVTLLTFLILRLLPGDPVDLYVGNFATPQLIHSVRQEFGLDQPIFVQYWKYLIGLVHGNLGTSIFTGNKVASDLSSRFAATFELTVLSMLVSAAFAIPLGVLAALKRGSIVDQIARLISSLGVSVPEFWLGLILIQIFFVQLHIAPAPVGQLGNGIPPPTHITGVYVFDSLVTFDWQAFGSALGHLVLPVVTLAFVYAAPIVRQTRSAVLSALGGEPVLVARANGLPANRITVRFALRQGLAPVITAFGLVFTYLLGGDVLAEVVFSWPGIGQYAVLAIQQQDYAAVEGVVLLTTFVIIIVYLLVDIAYAIVDPRITYGGGE